MEDSPSSVSHSSLLCPESGSCLDEEVEKDTFVNNNLKDYTFPDTEDQYIEMLLAREINFGVKRGESSCSLMMGDWFKSARLEAIEWVLKTRAVFRFRFQTAYLSMAYFDRFLLKRAIDSEKTWAIRLLSVACLSLAAKMEECRVPALSEFQLEDYRFESKVIRRMELLVLNTLEWRMGVVTPFAFVHYFISKFCKEAPPSNAVSKALELILAMMKDANLMDHRPSTVAAAAALMALEQGLTRSELEFKINSIASCRCIEIEDVFSCYSLMQKLETEKLKTTQVMVSPDRTPIHLSQTNAFDNSSVTSAISAKRRRLAFNDCDKNYGLSDEK
ncbi:cyclin-D5-1-like [Malania oleifera]|uniref:cyclin-D5-1-like n=1 Tax=Malania oleifera TaxID=397392 RepID=UPI0025AECD72|nr:cyclin-D5-1-like [Malania oleifera]